MTGDTPVFFTIASRNYLGYALSLMQSVAAQHPASPRYLCLVDQDDDQSVRSPWFDVVSIAQLGLPHFDAFVFRYDIMELNTAVKPWMFAWLRRHQPKRALIYLDPDIVLVDRMRALEQAFAAGAMLVLTPHLLAPVEDDDHPGELAILRSGTYNCGFVAMGAHAQADHMIRWWSDKLEHGCVVDLAAGLFTDQKWMDLAPGLFDDVTILRDPGYNVAYWNLSQRRISLHEGHWYANGSPLVFVHFSGVSLDFPAQFSRHQNRHTAASIGELRVLYDDYLRTLTANHQTEYARAPYAFGRFADSTPIAAAHRQVYRRLFDTNGSAAILHPQRIDRRVFDAPSEAVSHRDGLPITRLMYEIWRRRSDLHQAFDLSERDGRIGFIRWYIRTAERELGIAREHVEMVHAAFDGAAVNARSMISQSTNSTTGSPLALGMREPMRRIGAACIALIDWTCQHRYALALYRQVPEGLRRQIRRGLEALAYTPTPRVANSIAPVVAPPRTDQPDGLNLIGYARGEFGVAEILRSFVQTLQRSDLPFSVRNFDVGVSSRQEDRSIDAYLADDLDHSTNVFFINADQMPVVHQHLGPEAFAGRYNIGYWFWELENFPAEWDPAFDLVDEVWVSTDFIRAAVQARTRKPVVVIPNAVEVDASVQLDRAHFGIAQNEFVYLFSYDFNSWVSRKNPDAVIRAFRSAFPSDRHDVRLLIKSINGQRHPQRLRALLDAVADDGRIEIRDGFLSRVEMWALQGCCDAYVSLHRAEGFGLGMAESMLLGKPVVATAYSGNLAFMHSENSCLVDYVMIPVRQGEYPDWRGQHWADPDVAHAAHYLRRLVDEPLYAQSIGARARNSLRNGRSHAVTLAAIQARLAQIRGLRATPAISDTHSSAA
ncbi:MAG: glycosyltransferase family 4 protein [Tahibacter sp.]